MSGAIEIRGSLIIDGDGCGCGSSGSGANQTIRDLSTGCAKTYQAVIATAKALQISTQGALGDNFVDLEILSDLAFIEFLQLITSSDMIVRVGAAAATLLGSGGTFPTGFVGGETLDFTIDGGSTISATFTAGAQTAQQVANELNAAAALAGISYLPWTVDASGQLRLTGLLTGAATGSVAVTGGTGAATLGLSGLSAVGAGADLPINGLSLNEFSRNDSAPQRIQLSGQGSVSVVAGGRTS